MLGGIRMNLDDFKQYKLIDPQDMMHDIVTLPDQLATAWMDAIQLVEQFNPFPEIQNILITGMGGSAIAGDLIAAYIQHECSVPLMVLREYQLPAWVNKHTLVIASSHSGNTEETLSVVRQTLKAEIPLVRITTGGKIATIAKAEVSPCLIFHHTGQPRSAVGFSFAYMLAVLSHQGLIADPSQAIAMAVASMKKQQQLIKPEVLIIQNPAKRLAGQMVGRNVTIIGSGILATIARRWKGQFNELAKAWTGYDTLPEACHNSIAGTEQPESVIPNNFGLFLESGLDYPRNLKRSMLFHEHMMVQGFMTDALHVIGTTPMEIMWNGLNYGDYVAYYLALSYGIDPTPIEAIQGFKKDLGDFDQI
jgi:glucose/mannose-6-phosphate isomerase